MLATTSDFAAIYVGEPDIPAGLTIWEYRLSRPRRIGWWRRLCGISGMNAKTT